jgi:hypothetical protein
MNLGKALAISAVTGMLAGATAGCGDNKPEAKAPDTNVSAPGEKNCCKGKNECANKSGCKTETNASCAGQNSCKHKGTSCPKGG